MAFTTKPHHHTNAKAILGFLVVLLAFGILLLFVNYKDNIVASDALQPFIVLTAIGLGLLVGLVFLANQGGAQKAVAKHVGSSKAASKTSKASKKKKKRSR